MAQNHGFDIEAISDGLIAIVKEIAGIDVGLSASVRSVTDDMQPWMMPSTTEGATMKVGLIAVQSLGWGEEVRLEYDPDLTFPDDEVLGGFQIGVTGPRVLTFSISCECHDAKKSAFEYVERVRSNLMRPSIIDRIKALGCSFNSFAGSRDRSFVFEGRVVTKAGFDLLLNTVSNLDDDPVTTIDTMNATGAATGGVVVDPIPVPDV